MKNEETDAKHALLLITDHDYNYGYYYNYE
jgi:hypothetical protein